MNHEIDCQHWLEVTDMSAQSGIPAELQALGLGNDKQYAKFIEMSKTPRGRQWLNKQVQGAAQDKIRNERDLSNPAYNQQVLILRIADDIREMALYNWFLAR